MSRFGIAALAFAATVQAIVPLEIGQDGGNGMTCESPPILALSTVTPLKDVLIDDRHPRVVEEAVNASIIANGLSMMNFSKTYYNHLKAMEHLCEVHHNDGVKGENSLCYTLFTQIENRDRELTYIKEKLALIVGNDAEHPDNVVVTNELVKDDIQLLKSVMADRLRVFVNRILVHSDLNVKIRMLKTLSVDMMNSRSIHKLINVLASGYMDTLSIENEKEASKSLPDQLLVIDNYIKQFDSSVKEKIRILTDHLKSITSVRNPPVRKGDVDLTYEDREEHRECMSLWYQVNSIFHGYHNLVRFAKVFNASHKVLLDTDSIIAETGEIYELGMKVLRNTLLYHILYSKEIEDFSEGINKLAICSNKFKLPASKDVGSGIVSEITVHYLNSEFINLKTFCTKMEDWIKGLRLHSIVDQNDNVELHGIVQEVNQVTNDIFYVLEETGANIRHLYTMINDEDAKSQCINTHRNKCSNVKNSIDIGLKELRMLIMEWYQQLWQLGHHIPSNTRLFEEYDIVDEIRHLVSKAVKALQTDLPIHKNLHSHIKTVLETLSTVKGLYDMAGANERTEVDDIAINLNRKKDEAEFMISQFNISDESLTNLSKLNRDLKDLNIRNNPEMADKAVKMFFKMRSTVHKAVLLAESTTVVEMMQNRISGYERRLDEISKQIADLVMEPIVDSLPPEEVQSMSSQELVGHGRPDRDIMVYIPEQNPHAPDGSDDESITEEPMDNIPMVFQATVGAIGQAANMARLFTNGAISMISSSIPQIDPATLDPTSFYRDYMANLVPTLNPEGYLVSTAKRLRDNMVPPSNIPESSDDNQGPSKKLPRIAEKPHLKTQTEATTGHVRSSSDATMPDSPPTLTFQDKNAGSLLDKAISEDVSPGSDTQGMMRGEKHADPVTQPADGDKKVGERKGGSGHLSATSIGFGSALLFLTFTLI